MGHGNYYKMLCLRVVSEVPDQILESQKIRKIREIWMDAHLIAQSPF